MLQGSLMKGNVARALEINLEEERRRTESHCLRSSVTFPQSVMVRGARSSAGVDPLCSKVSTAIYQEVLEHFMLPAANQLYGDADFPTGLNT